MHLKIFGYYDCFNTIGLKIYLKFKAKNNLQHTYQQNSIPNILLLFTQTHTQNVKRGISKTKEDDVEFVNPRKIHVENIAQNTHTY